MKLVDAPSENQDLDATPPLSTNSEPAEEMTWLEQQRKVKQLLIAWLGYGDSSANSHNMEDEK